MISRTFKGLSGSITLEKLDDDMFGFTPECFKMQQELDNYDEIHKTDLYDLLLNGETLENYIYSEYENKIFTFVGHDGYYIHFTVVMTNIMVDEIINFLDAV